MNDHDETRRLIAQLNRDMWVETIGLAIFLVVALCAVAIQCNCTNKTPQPQTIEVKP